MTQSTFAQFNLQPELLEAIEALGFTEPTPIQQGTIPLLLTGTDMIGQAQTGTGKTAAFGLPLLQRIQPGKRGIQALVLAPTRELAMQVTEALERFAQFLKIRILSIYGGQSYQHQIRALRQGVEVVVGTPGRLLDLLDQGSLQLDSVQTVVLDEADEMLSMGFVDDIEKLLDKTPQQRQTLLFSATMSKRVLALSGRYLRDPQTVTIKAKQVTGSTIEQRHYLVNPQDKIAALTRLFEVEPIESALVFARTRINTGELANQLSARGFAAEPLSGDLSQEARIQVLNRFRNGQIKVLVATDVAARGLDIDDISHVFNFDLPEDPEVYVHRVGRTGRAGREGVAISLVTPRERWLLKKIEQYSRNTLPLAQLPTVEQIETHRQAQLMENLEVWIRRGRCRKEREMVEMLMATGHTPEDIAAAALKLARFEEKKRPIDPISPVRERSRETQRMDRGNRRGPRRDGAAPRRPSNKDMIALKLDIGKRDGIGVNHVVASLAHFSGIASGQLGKIKLESDHTLVNVPKPLVDKMLAKNGAYRIGRRPINLARI